MHTCTSRRVFLKHSTAAAAGFGALAYGLTPDRAASATPSVVKVMNARAIDDNNRCDRDQASGMIGMGLLALTGRADPGDAWAALGLTKDDVVGIKVNCNRAGFHLHAHPELVAALTESLQTVISANNIIIYERRTAELENVGFTKNTGASGVRCVGTDEAGGFDNSEELSGLVVNECSKLINLPSLKTFEGAFAGTIALKNHIGTLPHAHMPRCHGDTSFITNVNARTSIKDKTMLVLCDGLRATYRRSTPWYWKGILMSTDPVATEVTGLDIINKKRIAEGLDAMPIPEYVTIAETQYGLGISDTARINTLLMDMNA